MAKQWSQPPAMTIDPAKKYFATFKTDKGDIRIELYADKAPITVNNFVFLARQGFYDNTTFHRVIPGFMAQGGDPTGTGMRRTWLQVRRRVHPDLKHDGRGYCGDGQRRRKHQRQPVLYHLSAQCPIWMAAITSSARSFPGWTWPRR